MSVQIENADGSLQLKANGTQVLFAGFLRAFQNFDTGTTGAPQASAAVLHVMFDHVQSRHSSDE